MSGEPAMVAAVRAGEDLHDTTARQIYGVAHVDKGQRRVAKNVNFGFVFGAGEHKLATVAGIPGFHKLLNEKFPYATEFINQNKEDAEKTGYVLTPGGYPLAVPEGRSYAATNYRVQGAEGELVKQAMVFNNDFFRSLPGHPSSKFAPPSLSIPDSVGTGTTQGSLDPSSSWGSPDDWYFYPKLILQIHDELLFKLPINIHLPAVIAKIIELMRAAAQYFGFDIGVDAKLITTNWNEGITCLPHVLTSLSKELLDLEPQESQDGQRRELLLTREQLNASFGSMSISD